MEIKDASREDLEKALADLPEEGDDLEKALDSAIDSLSGGKGKGKDDEYYEVDEEEDEPEEEEEEKPKKRAKKSDEEPDLPSLSKSINEMIDEDDEAGALVDASPFIKSMVNAVEKQLTDFAKATLFLTEKLESLEKAHGEGLQLNLAQAKLIKQMRSEVKAMGDQPAPRKSKLGANLEIVRKSTEGKEEKITLNKSEALEKLTALHKADKISMMDVTKLEARIQRGAEIPEEYRHLFVEKVS